MQISCDIHTEISSQEALRGIEERTWGGVSKIGKTKGVRNRGGAHHGGSCPHADQRAAEVGGIERDRIYQGQECDPCGEALSEKRAQLRRRAFMGEGLFRGYGGKGHGKDQAIHPRAGDGGSPTGSVGTACTGRKTIKQPINRNS